MTSDGSEVETKFLRLRKPPQMGDWIDGWRVCWLGGWDKGRVFFVVMVLRKHACKRPRINTRAAKSAAL